MFAGAAIDEANDTIFDAVIARVDADGPEF
jgi:hypothetical protein